MPVDLTLPNTLGVHALRELSDSVHATKQLSVMSAMLAAKALNAGQKADMIISEISKINPALVGGRVRRRNLANKKFPNFRLFSAPNSPFEQMYPATIELTRTAAPMIPVQPMAFPTVIRGVENARCLVSAAVLQQRLALREFF